jgi:hypothetical protein
MDEHHIPEEELDPRHQLLLVPVDEKPQMGWF